MVEVVDQSGEVAISSHFQHPSIAMLRDENDRIGFSRWTGNDRNLTGLHRKPTIIFHADKDVRGLGRLDPTLADAEVNHLLQGNPGWGLFDVIGTSDQVACLFTEFDLDNCRLFEPNFDVCDLCQGRQQGFRVYESLGCWTIGVTVTFSAVDTISISPFQRLGIGRGLPAADAFFVFHDGEMGARSRL
jgi:hypothetical protein